VPTEVCVTAGQSRGEGTGWELDGNGHPDRRLRLPRHTWPV